MPAIVRAVVYLCYMFYLGLTCGSHPAAGWPEGAEEGRGEEGGDTPPRGHAGGRPEGRTINTNSRWGLS